MSRGTPASGSGSTRGAASTASSVATLLLVLLVPAVLVVAGAGLWWWARGDAFLAELRQQGMAESEEGRRVGSGVEPGECLRIATARAGECSAADMLCEARARAFLKGCLDATPGFAEFCASLPAQGEVLARLTWAAAACADLGRPDERCARVVNDATQSCAERRQPAMR